MIIRGSAPADDGLYPQVGSKDSVIKKVRHRADKLMVDFLNVPDILHVTLFRRKAT